MAAALHVVVGDPEALVIAAGLVIGAALLWFRQGLLGRLALLALFADIVFWMLPAAWSNVRHRDDLIDVAIPIALTAIPALGLVAVIALWRNREATTRALPAAAGALVVIAALIGVSRIPAVGESQEAQPGDLLVDATDASFEPDELTVDAGRVGVVVDNTDLFWHTFTIDELEVDIRLPGGASRRTEFDAAPGTYELVCAIPGHEALGMEGTLTVEEAPAATE